ncbi:MAG TPA: hypothetical protein VMF91_24425 [Bryobacteraceae bacterium]|nr:hypothetical protein [Bryobacteraceae bacterium]
MKRRGLIPLLFGAVFGASAQVPQGQQKETPYERPPMGGVPANNQCPVCSTMAPPYKAEPLVDTEGHVLTKPAPSRRTECVYCRVVFAQILEP